MAYNNNIPQPTDQINQSQAQLLGNFQALSTALIGVNNAGLLATNQVANPSVAANQCALFAKAPTLTASSATSVLATVKYTGSAVSSVAEFTDGQINGASTGWTRLPNGLLIKWMNAAVSASASAQNTLQTLTWPVATNIPVWSSAPTAIFLSIVSTGGGGYVGANVSLSFTGSTTTQFVMQIESYTFSGFTLGGWNAFNVIAVALGQG